MYRRILVPLDGSAASQRGLEEALRLARPSEASIVLLHVIEAYPLMPEMASAAAFEQIDAALREAGNQLLQAAHERVRAAGVACESHVVDAAAARVCDVVVAQAAKHRCDLIVMGTHGRRGLQHALIGSDAERVLRMSNLPVLLVRGRAGD